MTGLAGPSSLLSAMHLLIQLTSSTVCAAAGPTAPTARNTAIIPKAAMRDFMSLPLEGVWGPAHRDSIVRFASHAYRAAQAKGSCHTAAARYRGSVAREGLHPKQPRIEGEWRGRL